MPTYTPISSATLNSNTTIVNIANIPQNYTDLVVVITPASSSGTNAIRMRINGDATTSYSCTFLSGEGSLVRSARETNAAAISLTNYMGINSTVGSQSYILQISNYSNIYTNKSVLIRMNSALTGSSGVEANIALWRNTAAITSLSFNINTFGSSTGDFLAGSKFDVYGISPVSAQTAQAFGGTEIYYDSSYVYHVFKGSGTFIPYRSLTADVLVVAGGGGGGAGTNGSNGGGGGGAGGLLSFTSQSLTATSYSIIVGAGGTGNGGTGVSTNGTDSQFGALTLVKGGGAGGSNYGSSASWPGSTGGSGGGGYGRSAAGGSATSGQGYAGGTGGADSGNYAGAGGGGAGAVGENGNSASTAGNGGIGINTYSSWATATSTGSSGYYAGGGAGGSWSSTAATGGTGGGGNGGSSTAIATSGITNTGGGGGASGGNSTGAGTGKNGGSGIIIVRYAR